jgi:hypothetical protein
MPPSLVMMMMMQLTRWCWHERKWGNGWEGGCAACLFMSCCLLHLLYFISTPNEFFKKEEKKTIKIRRRSRIRRK